MRKKHGSTELEKVSFEKPISNPKTVSVPKKKANQGIEKMSEQDFARKMERLIYEEKYGDALFQIDENLKTLTPTPILLHLKGVAHGYAQEHEKALECFTKLTQMHPEIAQSWYQFACALTELERHEEAVEALKKAFEIDPDDPSTVFNLGVEIIKMSGDTKEALVYLKRADRLGHRKAHRVITEIENGTLF